MGIYKIYIRLKEFKLNFSESNFRLIDQYKRPITEEYEEGLLLYNGGTVCDDNFSDNSGTAICKLLGFQAVSKWANQNFWTSVQSSYSINLRSVRCSSPDWSSCTAGTFWGGCGHDEDVYLTCKGGCSPGQYLNSRSCSPCPDNTYSTVTGIHTSCTACPGESVSQEGSTQCLQCPAGFAAVEGEARCTCDKGLMWEWSSSTTASCRECPEGTFRGEGMMECRSCPEFSSSTARSENCSCDAGKYWNKTDCYDCSEGTYKSKGMMECQSCPEHSSSTRGSEHCSCRSGMYRNNTSCYFCPDLSASPEGALNCTECPPGSASLNNKTSCSCPAGQIWEWNETRVGSCQACPENTWRNEDMPKCNACPEFSESIQGSDKCTCSGGKIWNNSSCLNCVPGTFKSELMSSCIKCSSTSVSQDGAIKCLKCPPGSVALSNRTSCLCPTGMIWTWNNKTTGSCTICQENTYQSIDVSACLPCPLFSTSGSGSTTCSCIAGTYRNPNLTCSVCPAGTSSKAGSYHCSCPAGTFWNNTSCQTCEGSSVSNTGALRCQRCPSGTVPDRAMSSCSCLEGGVWTWSNHGNGSCITKRQFIKAPTETNSPYKSIAILLTCIAGILAMTSAVLSILVAVFYEKWKRRVEVREDVKVAYTPDKEAIYTKDPEGGQTGKGDEKEG